MYVYEIMVWVYKFYVDYNTTKILNEEVDSCKILKHISSLWDFGFKYIFSVQKKSPHENTMCYTMEISVK